MSKGWLQRLGVCCERDYLCKNVKHVVAERGPYCIGSMYHDISDFYTLGFGIDDHLERFVLSCSAKSLIRLLSFFLQVVF